MNATALYDMYVETRQQQAARKHVPIYTPMDEAAGRIVFNVAMHAMDAVRQDSHDVAMRTCSLGTGAGKSTSAWAFVATLAKADPEFTCAYVVPTAKLGMEAQEGIEALLGEWSTMLWTSYHKAGSRDLTKCAEHFGADNIPTRLTDKAALRNARVVIVTHKTLADEISGKDLGVRHYQGRPRSVVFCDEHPELLHTCESTATAIQATFRMIVDRYPTHPWLPVLARAAGAMNAVEMDAAQLFEPVRLLTADEGALFDDTTPAYLYDLTDVSLSHPKRAEQVTRLMSVLLFLRAASEGNAFYNRRDKTFSGYRLHFDNTYPGYVLLDATADLAGVVTLHPFVQSVRIPQVDYSPLTIQHIQHPKAFHNVSRVAKRYRTGTAYGEWIYSMVIGNSAPGDDVLIVTHLSILDHEYVKGSDDPAKPLDWEGRRVNTVHFGSSIGTNKWNHKTTVMIFGEPFAPQSVTVSKYHGWSLDPMTRPGLKLAEYRKVGGSDVAPRGPYGAVYNGDLLRQAKQLACRGSVRNIQPDGRCGPMKLVTSMSFDRLIEALPRMFPGFDVQSISTDNNDEAVPAKVKVRRTPASGGRAALARLLTARKKAIYGADEVQRITGIRASDLRREWKAATIKIKADAFGWTLQTAKEIGQTGRMLYLTRPAV
jgi:hypothetical protein